MGHAAAFSFYPGKNLGACGEAGAVTTNNEDMAKTMRIIRDHGQGQKYYHQMKATTAASMPCRRFSHHQTSPSSRMEPNRQEVAKRYDQLSRVSTV